MTTSKPVPALPSPSLCLSAPSPERFSASCRFVAGRHRSSGAAGTPSQPTEDKTVIVVTGTFEPAPLRSNRSVEVIPVLDTAPLHHHWTEALQSDASMDLRQRGQNGIQGDLSIRGSRLSAKR